MHLAVENKIKRINITNLQFNPRGHNSKPQHRQKQEGFVNEVIKRELDEKKEKKKQTGLTRNCFIPTASIKSQSQLFKNNRNKVAPLRPASVTYSQFPVRKTLSVKTSRNYIPVLRQRIFSFCEKQELNIEKPSPQSLSPKMKVRSVTASCFIMNKGTPENKSSRGNHFQRAIEDKWQTIERLYFQR